MSITEMIEIEIEVIKIDIEIENMTETQIYEEESIITSPRITIEALGKTRIDKITKEIINQDLIMISRIKIMSNLNLNSELIMDEIESIREEIIPIMIWIIKIERNNLEVIEIIEIATNLEIQVDTRIKNS
jgi:hypothetical protein